MSDTPRRPVLIDIEEGDGPVAPGPAEAPPVPDLVTDLPQGQAMQTVVAVGARRVSPLARLFWGALVSLVTFAATVAAWDFVTGLLTRNTFLGTLALGLVVLLGLSILGLALREIAGFFRLGRLDVIHADASAALAAHDLGAARKVVDRLEGLYGARRELDLGRKRLAERAEEQFDADALLGLAEVELMALLDAAARREVETAARQVATVTAIVPLALADMMTALVSTVRMIRRVGEIYGGRSGTLGSLRLTRSVLTHLVATGAVAVGDDLIHSVAGGGLLSRVSRRFGEGVVNGALTARVGLAAIEVCRPLPFMRLKKPSVSSLVKRALSGLFGTEG
ncbi:YcjF family protein [Tropicimonas isoalkanivorans]|uniref:Putative membrane protein n=1 Tax=Tropicimonas isoalkanivorans TaxID=441112 RepID=A0A1I1N9N3_9RHOB|nr:TIGR01620 family protein [Tropicimonas isoalkanivorans]SFC92178.1 putative membrane protein [Tropicimonas isoalkanivorans]